MLIGQQLEGIVCLTVVLDENNILDLNDIGIVLVDEMGGILSANFVVMKFDTGTAGALVPYLLEVVLYIARQDVVGGNADV